MYVFIYKYVCIYIDVSWYLKNRTLQTISHGIHHSWMVCHYDTKSSVLDYISEILFDIPLSNIKTPI